MEALCRGCRYLLGLVCNIGRFQPLSILPPSKFCVGVATSDDKVKVYDVRIMKLQLYSAHEGSVSQVKLYDLLEEHPIFTMHGHKKAAEFSQKGEFFYNGGQDSQVMV